jgi:hypothetical protein
MGKIEEGILGGFKGKVGTVVGGKWRGINYMRSKGSPNRTKFSEAQLMQQARFALGSQFIQPLQALYKVGYRSQIKRKTAINAALSDIITDCIDGTYPNFTINYEYLRISKGSLKATNLAQAVIEDGRIHFTWDMNENIPPSLQNNSVILAALGDNIYPSLSLLEFERNAKSGSIPLPTAAPGTLIHCYIGFASASTPEVSNSYYAGAVSISV